MHVLLKVKIKPLTWWKPLVKLLESEFTEVLNQLCVAVAPSAGAKEVFSSLKFFS